MRSVCSFIVLLVWCSSSFGQGKVPYTVSNGVHITGVDGTNPVIYDNDLLQDTPDVFYLWLKAHKGQVKLVGNINTRDMHNNPNYTYTHDDTFFQWVNLYNAAQQINLQNIPAPVKGTSIALVKPASGVIEQTQYSTSVGSELIITEAHKASREKPLVIFVGGNVSSIANAYLKDNSIADKIVVLHVAGYKYNAPTYNTTDFWSSYVVMKRFRYVNWAGNGYEYWDGHKPIPVDLTGMPDNPFTTFIKIWYGDAYRTYQDVSDSPVVLWFFNHGLWRNVDRRLENDQTTTSDTYDYLKVSDNDFSGYGPMVGEYLRDPNNYTATPTNSLPTVSLTAPANNASFTAGATVTLTANASDTDGSISRVEFFNGNNKIGEDLSAPYSFAWTNVAAGTFTLTAKATDNQNGVKTSSAVTINVAAANTPPTVAITAPANNASFAVGASVTISANASDNASVAKVEFFNGNTKLGEDATSPYLFVWANVAAGTYTITARATDNENAATTSSAITINVAAGNTAPAVTLTAPANNATFATGTSITLTATATDNVSVAKVEFFNGNTKLGEDATNPYSFVWPNVPAGTYSITARATDNQNAATTSAAITINVAAGNTAPVVTLTAPANNTTFATGTSITLTASASDNGSVAKVEFFNGTTKLGEDTSSPYSFAWANVAAGTYTLTAKATDNQNATTTSAAATITVAAENAPPTVSLSAPSQDGPFTAGSTIALTATAADTDGTISKVEFFNGDAKLGEDATSPYSYEWTNVGVGSYELTAKATDNKAAAATSAKVSVSVGEVNTAPHVTITSPTTNSIFPAGTAVTFQANATDNNGTVTKVEFYNGLFKLGEDLTSPYSFVWSNIPAGSYAITAKATDNENTTTTSKPVAITLTNSTNPTADAGEDVFLTLPENSVSLSATGVSAGGPTLQYSWVQLSGPTTVVVPGNPAQKIELTNLVEGTYVLELTVTDPNGLTGKDQIKITVAADLIVQSAIPRYFTPNGDGVNDFWEWPKTEIFEKSILMIFDRTGKKVYDIANYNNTWDGRSEGKALSDDAYYYIIRLFKGEAIKGTVRIIR